MIDQQALKLEARLGVIEVLIFELFSFFYRGISADDIHKRHDALLSAMASRVVHGVDPVVSDLLTGEIEGALQALLMDLEAYVEKPRFGARSGPEQV